jgi:hypothetical protein
LVAFDAMTSNAQSDFGFACFGVTRFFSLDKRGRASDKKEKR